MMNRHAAIEKNVILLAILTLITVSIGGLVQIIPLFTIGSTIERVQGCGPIRRWSSRAATSISAKAAICATAR